jgi:hypothetical protein
MSGPHLRVFVISAFTSLLAVVLMMVTFGMFARREVLEVDSRVVSLRRGSQLMSWAPRQKCTHVALITSSPARTALSPFGTPRLQLGAENENWILAGFGISNGAAVRLVTAIEEFLADVPPEQLS